MSGVELQILKRLEEVRRYCCEVRGGGASLGFVPTMGSLHDGHLSLLRRSRQENDVTLVSIFVNPAQFCPGEDFDDYPRDLAADLRKCEELRAAAVFAPSTAEMYPSPSVLNMDFGALSSVLEGRQRPSHFEGVGLVVAKLFGVVGACRAYFGEKDWQQLAVVRRLVCDLALPVEVVGCSTVRDPDGLALSSRNAYLTPSQRESALALNRCLRLGEELIRSGERSRIVVEDAMAEVLAGEAALTPYYSVVVDADSLVPVDPLRGRLRLLGAVGVGETRLIDNLGCEVRGRDGTPASASPASSSGSSSAPGAVPPGDSSSAPSSAPGAASPGDASFVASPAPGAAPSGAEPPAAPELTSRAEEPAPEERPVRPDATAAALHSAHGGLQPGESSGVRAAVSGRLMLRRTQGRICFGTLDDASGERIQLFATKASTPDYEAFCGLSIGDWLWVSGEVIKTRRGELSVAVNRWSLLAEARLPFPDKWRGLADVDVRYRRRYVDLWVSPSARRTLLLRSRLIEVIRRELAERGFVEVETPMLHPIPGGAAARPFVTHHNSLNTDLYLRIAPELYLKRLVVGGFQRVFEIGRVFRNEGLSPRHSPEFTMLELYQAYADYGGIMELTECLVADAVKAAAGGTLLRLAGQSLDLTPPWRRATMEELVAEVVGCELTVDHSAAEARRLAESLDVEIPEGRSAGEVLAEVYERRVEGALVGPVFVCDFPVEVSPLARSHRSRSGLVERFEAVVAGKELANAFSELTDPVEQRRRFAAQDARRAGGDSEAMATDEDFLRALEYGMPPTGGLGIGIDRLAMLVGGADNIRDVILFPTLRPEQARGEAEDGRKGDAERTEDGGASAGGG